MLLPTLLTNRNGAFYMHAPLPISCLPYCLAISPLFLDVIERQGAAQLLLYALFRVGLQVVCVFTIPKGSYNFVSDSGARSTFDVVS